MKAIVYTEYGPPEVLKLKEVNKPEPKDDEVLIKVHAATVTSGDVNMRGFTFVPKGFGPLPRLMFGIRRPRKPILGTEVAGEIEALGKDVRLFEKGDRVFGIGSGEVGAYAEYVCRKANGPLVKMPDDLCYEEAAAVPAGAGTAVYFLRDKAKVQSGQRVLVNGASGGVGTFAVQIAKYYGAEVTAVCSTGNLAMVKSLSADHAIDYSKEDFTKNGLTYDVIYDTVSKRSFAECKQSLAENGLYLDGAGGPGGFIQMGWTSLAGSKKVLSGTPAESKDEILFLKELLEAGHICPVIDRRYPLEQTADAHRYVDMGHKKGHVVITVVQDEDAQRDNQ